MTGRSEELVHPFPALYDASSRILILGSFPSAVSRQQSFYYANATNRFWPIMEAVFEMHIEDRRQFCLDQHIALWDVIYSCRIKGSSDASISDVKVNDIQKLINETKIHTVFTTGAKAAKLYDEYAVCDAEHIALPSTSAANARMRLSDLTEEYAILREKLYER
ncbi:MAG: DNA-deoxyinosine glycosylase [Solobacterium sp.]|jgi:hypoxanthine-DNA glycosylase|nr:DNA-deoxyinosine glycosylase [Solobacterium sp.]MCH4205008.1 DNA-deoxyinosine glycosylase [Solobacterium sp.]MCH4226517.1 DNA-deoxyinosine glycosylase [Solobacterium sp.]MCH4281801.1 DNA-deoxyinosine glycosylase [Solobacterium sp.]